MTDLKPYITHIHKSFQKNSIFLLVMLLVSSTSLLVGIENPMTVELMFAFIIVSVVQMLLLRNAYPIYLLQVLLAILLLLEVFAARRLKSVSQVSSFHEKELIEKVDGVGTLPLPHVQGAREVKLFGKDTIFDVRYSTDSFRRRIPENPLEFDRNRSKHAILLGCSFTFGFGLDYKNSMPAIAESMDTACSAYDYGFSGLAPHHLALMFEPGLNIINRNAVPQEKGFMLYTFIGDHLDRVYGSSSYLAWANDSPEVSAVDGRLVFSPRNAAKVWLSKLIAHSKTLNLFKVGFTYPKNEKYYRRFAGLINYMSASYHKLYPGNPFFVGLYPENWGPKHKELYDLGWVPFLDSTVHLIRVPDPPDFEVMNPKYWIPHDGHPTRTMNTYYMKNVIDAFHDIEQKRGTTPKKG